MLKSLILFIHPETVKGNAKFGEILKLGWIVESEW